MCGSFSEVYTYLVLDSPDSPGWDCFLSVAHILHFKSAEIKKLEVKASSCSKIQKCFILERTANDAG